MTRATQQISIGLFLSALYTSVVLGLVPIVPSKVQTEIIPVLPLWALVSFGAYLLGKIGYALLVFNDVPEAYQSLMKEIDEARVDLRKKGVDVD